MATFGLDLQPQGLDVGKRVILGFTGLKCSNNVSGNDLYWIVVLGRKE